MSFVPVTGPATFQLADAPRESSIEFTGAERTVALPIRAALPVLRKARVRDDAHPSVQAIAAAALLAMQLVAAGRFEPREGAWRPTALTAEDEDRVRRLAAARTHDELAPEVAEELVRGVVAAVVDAMPRTAPTGTAVAGPAPLGRARPEDRSAPPVRRPSGDFTARLQRILASRDPAAEDDRPQLVSLSLRVEADDEELLGGSVRLVLQVHDERNPLHVVDAAVLWTESGPDASHGFGDRARTHATIALRAASESWTGLDRFLDLAVPDQITLDTVELADFLDHGAQALGERGIDVLWPRSLGRDLTSRAVLSSDRPAGGDEAPLQEGMFGPDALFSFSWQLALHGEPLTPEEMDTLATATAPILKLRNNWVVVDGATLRKARKRLIHRATPSQALAATLTGVVEVGEVTEQVIVGATLEKVRARLLAAATRDPVDVPAGLRAELREYQRHGLTWLADLTGLGLGACLADDMGLGKTITLLALHLHRVEAGASGPTLVVCPASLMGNWEAEARRFAPGVPVRRFHGGERHLGDLSAGLVLTTYGTMRNDAAALAQVPWDLVVADEAQHVKNSRTSTARALRSIPSAARVALTGTPLENDLTELWSILDWTNPGLLGSRQAFRRVWAAPIESGEHPSRAREFADLVEPFLLRRRKSDPGIAPELPPKTETDHLLRLTREQVVLYESFVRDSMRRIEEADAQARRGLVLAMLTGLKQICNHPAHFLRQSHLRGRRSEKLDLLDEVLGTVLAEDGAVLVFTQYVAMARLLEQHLTRAGITHQFLHGGTPVREREAMVDRFQAGEVPVFLLSLKAGGTGLNLTRADHVVHVDRWWNPAVEEQATDRAYRIGQTKPVQVHRLVTQGTIEERIAQLLDRKRALADAVLARGEAALTELSDADLRDLVTLRRDAATQEP